MNVLVLNKSDFNASQFNDVKNIAFTETTFVITKSDNTTVTFTKADYNLTILW